MELSFWERFKIKAHEIFSLMVLPLILLLLFPFLFVFMGYRVRNLKKMQEDYARLVKERHTKPTLICFNHLTYIDSLLFAICIMPFWKMFFNYSLLPWHVLELTKAPYLCPLFKALPVRRMGDKKKTKLVLARMKYMIEKGNLVVIFPEGTRSSTGRVNMDRFQYGVGDVLREVSNPQVLCVYLRADKQVEKSIFFPKGSTIDVSLKLIEPRTELLGMRASRDLATQVMETINEMEKKYFLNQL